MACMFGPPTALPATSQQHLCAVLQQGRVSHSARQPRRCRSPRTRCHCAADIQQATSVPPDVRQELHWQVCWSCLCCLQFFWLAALHWLTPVPALQLQIREGPVTVAPLQEFEVAGAAVLVARAFAGSPGLFSFEGIV